MVKAIGLVLGAGGLTGSAFHAGVLAALHEATGWDPRGATVVVGTSAGASTAAYLRAGFAAEDLFAEAVGGELSPEAARRHAALPPLRLGPVTNDALAPLPEPAAAGGGEREAAAVRVGGD
ncbi:MAG: patatin-like phospholipase family protein, partial [Acidimicrobiales bacterium]